MLGALLDVVEAVAADASSVQNLPLPLLRLRPLSEASAAEVGGFACSTPACSKLNIYHKLQCPVRTGCPASNLSRPSDIAALSSAARPCSTSERLSRL